ncbi:MAG: ABC-F family ATP-binding cassette domain-containing protein [Candidatus Dependentiae bacterium]
MINIKNLNLSFSSRDIFNEVSFSVDQSSRMGLVGLNGSGKSTLLKIIAGQQEYDNGSIAFLPGKKIAYMPQDVVLQSDKTILQEALDACGDVTTIQKRSEYLESQIEQGITDDHIIDEYVQLQEQLAYLDPKKLQIEAERILLGLGFKQPQMNQLVSTLSVGWKMRIVLAKLLLQKADFYLFDEPTNHLDIVAKDWFLHFLKNTDFGFMLVCHERYFLDQVCSTILALENSKAKIYKGNYSTFEKQYAKDLEQLHSAYALQQKDIQRRKETIAKFRAKANKAKMAQSMQKQLDKLELITLPPTTKKVSFQFPATKRAGRMVLQANGIAHKFDSKKLFENIDLNIERGQKVSLIAANGVGKTTLFNIIVDNLPIQNGSVEFGANVDYAIFAQDQNESLDFNKTIFENAKDLCSKKSEQQIRSFLGAFLFSSDDVNKKVGVLSGGEKNRVAMAIVLMQDANFLLLDEPTNHLDMPSKDILIQALQNFDGTILFVSHDHYFINKLANRVVELTPNGAFGYEGNYDAYLDQKNAHKDIAQPKQKKETQPKNKPQKNNKENYEQSKQIHKLERSMAKLEKEIARIELSFADLVFGTHDFDDAQQKLHSKKEDLESSLKQWEALQ